MIAGGCKESYRETFARPRDEPRISTSNMLSISSGVSDGALTGCGWEERRQAGGSADSEKKFLISISTRQHYWSEGGGVDIRFFHPTADFEYLNLSRNSAKKVYFSSCSMMGGVGPVACRYFRIQIKKMSHASWYVSGSVSCEIDYYGKIKLERINLNGLFKGMGEAAR